MARLALGRDGLERSHLPTPAELWQGLFLCH
jgi:hypothetical protein